MALQCNIDARGKLRRMLYGIVLFIIGVALLLMLAWPSGSWLAWGITILTFLAGAFCVFESRAGWCALRAMGFKTRI